MDLLNILLAVYEAKKQYIIIAVIVASVTSVGGYYAIKSYNTTNETQETTINVNALKQENPIDDSKAASFREGEFKESKKMSF